MDLGAKEILLVIVGFVLAWVPQWFDRRRRIVAHGGALRAEAFLCTDCANALLTDGMMAPLYRLPTIAFEKAFPVLLVEGELTEEQVLAPNRFFNQAQDINRGLENATHLAQAGDDERPQDEYKRLLLKASTLVNGPNGRGGLSVDAFTLVNEKLRHSRILR
ncbi:hypothetical protein [uncultured Piscinibacter sp.]|uniref:hypothetical protein n=1 Tax=uncultured Piscinibacter sp. TaxID=1131835 RepID=UPI00261A45F3|nr:hypothetical protein [uncultured Piscinibacter sp.]